MIVVYTLMAFALAIILKRIVGFLKAGQKGLAALFIVVAVLAVGVSSMMARTDVDTFLLDRELKPLLERDYPGWSHESFSY